MGKITSAGWAVIDGEGRVLRRYARRGDAKRYLDGTQGLRIVELWYSTALTEGAESGD